MQYTISINQVKALEWGLNAQQALLFAFIYECPSWANPIETANGTFYAVSKQKITEELPLLTDKPDTAYRLLKQLQTAGLIELSSTSKITLVRLTEKAKCWNKKHDGSEIYPSKRRGKKSEVGNKSDVGRKNIRGEVGKISELRSEKSPTNQYTSNQSTNNQDTSQSLATEVATASTATTEIEITPSMGANSPDRTVQIRPIDGCNSASSMGANSPLLTETTTEITTETTTDTLATEVATASTATTEIEITSSPGQPKVEIPADMPGPKDPKAKTYRVWANYAFAFRRRYNVWPVWNARTAGQLAQLVDRLVQDAAPKVAAYYLTIADARLITEQHSVNLLLARAEALHTQWASGRRVNGTTARQQERTAANFEAAQTAAKNILEKAEGSIYDNPFYKP